MMFLPTPARSLPDDHHADTPFIFYAVFAASRSAPALPLLSLIIFIRFFFSIIFAISTARYVSPYDDA